MDDPKPRVIKYVGPDQPRQPFNAPYDRNLPRPVPPQPRSPWTPYDLNTQLSPHVVTANGMTMSNIFHSKNEHVTISLTGGQRGGGKLAGLVGGVGGGPAGAASALGMSVEQASAMLRQQQASKAWSERQYEKGAQALLQRPSTPPYVHQSYPKWLYHRERGSKVVETLAQHEHLLRTQGGWTETP